MKPYILTAATVLFLFTFACNSAEKKTETVSENINAPNAQADTIHYRRMGDSIVKLTFDTLRNALAGTIAEKGAKEAISYCNVNAYPITAYYAGEGISIRRTSLRYRNPANSPDSLESAWLEKLAASAEQNAAVFAEGNRIHYFKPILLQSMCKNCHGDPSADILPATLAEIRKRYPDDKATGYREGELRGMWHLVFPEKQ